VIDWEAMSWRSFERQVVRLMMLSGVSDARLVGQTSDKGADVIGHRAGRRWLVQVKHWRQNVGISVLDRTLDAMRTYRADVPIIVALRGFDAKARSHQETLQLEGIPMQLWGARELNARWARLPDAEPVLVSQFAPRPYQEEAIQSALRELRSSTDPRALLVLATGLGKTTIAAETMRRLGKLRPVRVLVLAHTNDLVLQLERAFWPFIRKSQQTHVWNGQEKPPLAGLRREDIVFATIQSAAARGEEIGDIFDVVIVDECHHAGSDLYQRLLSESRAGQPGGPALLGLTATPWRADEIDLSDSFGPPTVTIDLIRGLREGFLANVDYRIYTDNVDWARLSDLSDKRLTPRRINDLMFVKEWDEGVITELAAAWREIPNPRAIVFCSTIDHAVTVRDRINARGFCSCEALFSGSGRLTMEPHQRGLILADFAEGKVQVICAVDIFNEGVDVPDVNLLVFQRVTHSRRIFIQQLGRGLRLAPDKDRVIVLDFVSDVRRFAAGLDLKDRLGRTRKAAHVALNSTVEFRRAGSADSTSEPFLREWLEDVAAVERASEDASVLRFPPKLT
jgi:superfamily II DNA or RNA helicase